MDDYKSLFTEDIVLKPWVTVAQLAQERQRLGLTKAQVERSGGLSETTLNRLERVYRDTHPQRSYYMAYFKAFQGAAQ